MRFFGSSTIPLQKIIASNAIPLLVSVVVLQACGPKIESGSPAQEPEPLQPPTSSQSMQVPPSDKYVFIEIWIEFDGTGSLPMKFIDFPGYEYDSATGALKSYGRGAQISLQPEEWGFIGLGEKRNGAAGGGTVSQLSPIDRLPFAVSAPIFTGKIGEYAEEIEYIPVTLRAVSMDGEALIDIDGQQIALPTGEMWKKVQGTTVNTERFNGSMDVMFSIINYGWNSRDRIDSQ